MIMSERLILRGWREEDVDPFHAMCGDPRVMATLGPLMTREETEALVRRVEDVREAHGYTFWAVERRADGAFLGWCGVKPGAPDTPIADDLEIGWRIAAGEWGKGYAREAAQASLDWAWANLNEDAVWAITVPANVRSWGLMERLGMTRHADLDFDMPAPILPPDSPHLRHITYSIGRAS